MLSKERIILIVVTAIVLIVVTSVTIYYTTTSTTTTTTTTSTSTTDTTTTTHRFPEKSITDKAMVSLCDSSPASQSQTGSPGRESIYGGKLVPSIADHPWMVLLKITYHTRGVYWCGATLIDDRHVLTAAHCVARYDYKDGFLQYNEGDTITAYLGSTSKNTPATVKTIESAFMHIAHRKFVKGGRREEVMGHRDIAVLRLNESLLDSPEWNTKIKPACLPTATEMAPSSCVVTGWGHFVPYQLSTSLFMKDIHIINSYTECAKMWVQPWMPERTLKRIVDQSYEDSILCSKGPDACSGDSGGPVVCKTNTSPEMKLFGIVSGGNSEVCGAKSRLTGTSVSNFINVPFFRSWLQYVALPALRNGKSSAAWLACLNQKCLDFGYVQLITNTTDQRIKEYVTSWICRLFPPYYFCTFLDPKPERCQKTVVPKVIYVLSETPTGSGRATTYNQIDFIPRSQLIDSLKEITCGVSDLDTCTP
ncbi:chymotrypsin-C-like [Littorina saxatilis]|uniref:chymotrypsin-C-like n=1 Tax=Littorina saxatilis TaxID=31220 RepID=UPI0038B4780B